MVTLTIDGHAVTVPEDTTILEAARSFFSILSPPYAATALTTVFEMLMAVCAA